MKSVLSGVGDTFYGTALITISLSKNLYIFEKGVWGVAPSGVRAAAPHSPPFWGKGAGG